MTYPSSQTEQRNRAAASNRRRGFVAGSTGARPGIMTSELWLTILMTAIVIVFGYVSDTFDNDLAWALGAGIVAAYVLSRGFAKAGSREGPFMIDLGDNNSANR